jgi:hypothetical protein
MVTALVPREPQTSQPLDQWDAAYRRTESYLQACGVEPRILLTEIAMKTVDEARKRAANDRSHEHPVTLTMGVLLERMAAGFSAAFEDEVRLQDQLRARGRLALATSGEAPRWARRLLDQQRGREESFGAYLQDRPLQPGPEMRLSKMPPARIEFAFGDNDEDPPLAAQRMPISALALAICVIGTVGAAWAVTH